MTTPRNNVLIINDLHPDAAYGEQAEAVLDTLKTLYTIGTPDEYYIKGDHEAYPYMDTETRQQADALLGIVGMHGYSLGRHVALAEQSDTPAVLIVPEEVRLMGHLARVEAGATKTKVRFIDTVGSSALSTALDVADVFQCTTLRAPQDRFARLIAEENLQSQPVTV